MGTQVWSNGDGTMTNAVLFSIWDASNTVATSGIGGCSRFGGEGAGSHCLIYYTLTEGSVYNLTVYQSSTDSGGSYWTGTITDVATRITTTLGTLYLPNYNGYSGYGGLQIQSAGFSE